MITITGAAGHIGNVLVRKLLKQGEQVRVLLLRGEDDKSLVGLDVEKVYGNILDYESLKKAFKDTEIVYHLAAIVSITKKQRQLMDKVNIEGTENVIRAGKEMNVKRLVYTSSIHAFVELEREAVLSESNAVDPEKIVGDYAKSKAAATLEVLKASKESLETVVVAPAGVLGPYDFRPSEMGQLFIEYINQTLKAYVDGEYNFVDVRDVVDGMIAASKKGRSGEIYLLTGEVMTVPQIMNMLQEVTGITKPKWKLPLWFAYITTPLAMLYYKIKKTRPLFTQYSIYTLTTNSRADNGKARRELGFSPRPLKNSVIDTTKWLEKEGMVKIKKK
ncbi:SDR family oxidoreductase [Patescibacteria group bacterium]|nr:SDR family oxidoreductase [Patescibacteria group bacterium]